MTDASHVGFLHVRHAFRRPSYLAATWRHIPGRWPSTTKTSSRAGTPPWRRQTRFGTSGISRPVRAGERLCRDLRPSGWTQTPRSRQPRHQSRACPALGRHSGRSVRVTVRDGLGVELRLFLAHYAHRAWPGLWRGTRTSTATPTARWPTPPVLRCWGRRLGLSAGRDRGCRRTTGCCDGCSGGDRARRKALSRPHRPAHTALRAAFTALSRTRSTVFYPPNAGLAKASAASFAP